MTWILTAAAFAQDPPDNLRVLDGVEVALHGFLDVGWFDVTGDGVSYRYVAADGDGVWLYTGDPWAVAVNSQGDSADLGNDFNNLQRDDRIASGGRPTFLVNAYEQEIELDADRVGAEIAVWVEPRSGELGSLGDVVSLDRGFVWWRSKDIGWELQAGKIESTFGLEWYHRRAPDRIGVTPSLVSRYTTGTPIGVAGEAQLLQGRVELSGSITNGSTTTERFGHFSGELDDNGIPTATVRLVAGAPQVKLGVSGQVGAVDGQPDAVPMFQVGGDLTVNRKLWYLRAEYLLSDQDQGRASTDRLHAHGGYVQVWANVRPWLAPLLRIDRRVATVDLPVVGNHYETDTVRFTAGARFPVSYNLIAKAEFLHLWEVAGLEIDDDVVTASLVFRY